MFAFENIMMARRKAGRHIMKDGKQQKTCKREEKHKSTNDRERQNEVRIFC
jgi:hypothetical protein